MFTQKINNKPYVSLWRIGEKNIRETQRTIITLFCYSASTETKRIFTKWNWSYDKSTF